MNAPAQNGTALAVVPRADSIEPRSMAELVTLSKAAAASGFFGAKTPDQALLICMSGRDLGLSYSQALRAFHVIEGKPCLSADGMVAACLVRRDVCEFFRTVEVTDKEATVETKRMGQEARRYTFTLADAQRAEVAHKPTWKRYPSRMLLARARAALARDVYPDLLLGLYDPNELQESPAAVTRTVTADGEVIEPVKASEDPPPATAEDFSAFIERFREIGTNGSRAEYRKACGEVSKMSSAAKLALSVPAKEAKASIEAREKASREADEAFAGEGRQPGDEG